MKFSQNAQEVTIDQVISGTTLVGIDELQCKAKPFGRCIFCFYILFQQSSALDSIKVDLAFPANLTSITYNITIPGVPVVSNAIGIGLTLAQANTDFLVTIEGQMVNGATQGFLQPKIASTGALSSVTVKANSCVLMTAM